MKYTRPALVLLLFGMLSPNADAQYSPGTQMFGQRRPTLQTLLFVRLAGPEGMKITFYRGQGQAVTLATPCTVGLRPGYTYRIALSEMKKYPGQIFYPTLEVHGSILLGGNLRACDFPAGLVFRDLDFNTVNSGALIKKVVFLERVADAVPESSPPDNPFEIVVEPPGDPMSEARAHGLPVMTAQMGQRQQQEIDLIAQGIPGTILLPGEPYLPFPPRSPSAPWMCYPMYDPQLGAAPWLYYSLPGGGDWGPPAGFDADGKLVGVDPADTVVEFKPRNGQPQIAASNRVYLCIPRFLIARVPEGEGEGAGQGNPLVAMTTTYGPDAARNVVIPQSRYLLPGEPGGPGGPGGQSARLQIQRQVQTPESFQTKEKPSGADNFLSTSVSGKIENLEVKATVARLHGIDGNPKPTSKSPGSPWKVRPFGPSEEEEADAAEAAKLKNPLRVIKWPDSTGGKVGSIVTFFIQYTNQGRRPITNVVVTDSLITRFEYVKDSARTDREANFTIQPNNAGSNILRWEFTDTLRGGESGMVSFQVRIR